MTLTRTKQLSTPLTHIVAKKKRAKTESTLHNECVVGDLVLRDVGEADAPELRPLVQLTIESAPRAEDCDFVAKPSMPPTKCSS